MYFNNTIKNLGLSWVFLFCHLQSVVQMASHSIKTTAEADAYTIGGQSIRNFLNICEGENLFKKLPEYFHWSYGQKLVMYPNLDPREVEKASIWLFQLLLLMEAGSDNRENNGHRAGKKQGLWHGMSLCLYLKNASVTRAGTWPYPTSVSELTSSGSLQIPFTV